MEDAALPVEDSVEPALIPKMDEDATIPVDETVEPAPIPQIFDVPQFNSGDHLSFIRLCNSWGFFLQSDEQGWE